MTMSILENRSGVFQYFLNRRVAGESTAQSILSQCHHSKLDRFLSQDDGRRALVDQLTQRVRDFHQLINSSAAFVSGVVAGIAPFTVEELAVADVAFRQFKLSKERVVRLVGRAAVGTNATKQTLTEHGFERCRDQERLEAHVDQTRDGAGSVVGVQRGEDEMAGERRLDCDLRRLQVARLA